MYTVRRIFIRAHGHNEIAKKAHARPKRRTTPLKLDQERVVLDVSGLENSRKSLTRD
jgi:hypothetical protein